MTDCSTHGKHSDDGAHDVLGLTILGRVRATATPKREAKGAAEEGGEPEPALKRHRADV